MSSAPSPLQRATVPNGYRSEIDGLRAIAILAVIGFHYGIPGCGGGFVGVDIFFVISGYLICSIIYRDTQRDRFSIARFYERRFKRIIPALAVVLLFCLLTAALVLSPYEAKLFGDSAVATALSASNLLFLIRTGYFAPRATAHPLLMTWSLAVEEQFYLIFPLLMILWRRQSQKRLLWYIGSISVLSLLASIYGEVRLPTWNFYLPVTRAWELGCGALLAIWQNGNTGAEKRPTWTADAIGATGILMMLVSIVFYRQGMRFPGYEALLPVLGAALVLAAPEARSNRLLSSRIMVAIGLISYSLYLWHWPLLSFAGIMSSKPLGRPTLSILLALTVVAATLSYFLIEKPFRSATYKNRTRVLLSYGFCIAGLALLGGVFSFTHGLARRYPTLYAMENGADLFRHHPCISAGSYLRLSEFCTPAESEQPAMAIMGDSHAEAMSVGMKSFASANGWKLVTLTRESCPPTADVSPWSKADNELSASCRRFNKASLDYVLARKDIRVVLLSGRWFVHFVPAAYTGDLSTRTVDDDLADLKMGLGNEVRALESGGKRVIIMEDVPSFPYDPVAGLRNQEIPLRRWLNHVLLSAQPENGEGNSEPLDIAVSAGAEGATQQIRSLADGDPALRVIDPKQVLCSDGRCYFANGSDLYYYDTMHLSLKGAQQIVPLLPDLPGLSAPRRAGFLHGIERPPTGSPQPAAKRATLEPWPHA